jgi:putative Holliday junction resolvase
LAFHPSLIPSLLPERQRKLDEAAFPVHGRRVRILGLDVGSKTIGVAVSDELLLCAHAQKTLVRRGTRKDVETVLLLCKQHQTTRVVVGLPYDCEGNEGHRAKRVRVLGDALAAAGLAIDYQDESFSTVEAENVLLAADLSRARRKEVVDRLAAAVILQAWLDAQRPKSISSEEPI